jgi:hypothetical protein
MKKYILILALLFSAAAQSTAWGQIKYHNSLPYFHQLGQDSIRISSYNEAQLPIYQQVEVQFTRAKNALTNMQFTTRFDSLFKRSHQLMERAEKTLQKRLFSECRILLDSIESIYPYYPYLYSTYFILAQKSENEQIITELFPVFKSNEMLYHKNERSQTYYELYEFYRDAKQPKKAEAFLEKSHLALPSAEKQRILEQLRRNNAKH